MPPVRKKAAIVPEPPAPTPLLKVPTSVTLIASVVLGVFAGFIHSFGLGAPWPALFAFLAATAGVYGIQPLVGSAFKNLLGVTPSETLAITGIVGSLAIALPYLGISPTLASVLQGVVVFAGSLGFGTTVNDTVAARSRS